MGETNQRYTQLSKNTDIYILGDAPLVLLGRALLYDTKEDKIIGQLKFQSISEKTIIAFKISVIGFDVSNVQIERSEFQYLDLKMKENDVTGSQTPIVFSNKNVRKFVFWISEIVYGDGSIENPSNHELILVEKKLISDVLDKELAEQYKRSLNCKLSDECGTYIPTSYSERAWICSCGKINGIHREKCYRCESEFSDEVKLLNKEYLESQLEEYKKEKELESIEKAKKIKELKKRAIIGTCAVVIAGVMVWGGNQFYKKVMIPYNQYKEAGRLTEEKNYRTAKKIYEDLGNYKDSKEQIKKLDELIEEERKENKYQSAIVQYKSGNNSDALTYFQEDESYKDSVYYIGKIKKESGKYDEAISYFNKVKSTSEFYKDSISEKEECYYTLAREDLSNGKLNSAKQKLIDANGVNGSDKVLKVVQEEIDMGWSGVYQSAEDPELYLEILCLINPYTSDVSYEAYFQDSTTEESYVGGQMQDDGSLLLIDTCTDTLTTSTYNKQFVTKSSHWFQPDRSVYYSGGLKGYFDPSISGRMVRLSLSDGNIIESYRLIGESWDNTEFDDSGTHVYNRISNNVE